jgi:hypothetical protein
MARTIDGSYHGESGSSYLSRTPDMNLAWVVSRSEKPRSRNLHAKDRAKLVREGHARYRLECSDATRGVREADVYAQRLPTQAELLQAAQELFGAPANAKVRLLDADGKPVKLAR